MFVLLLGFNWDEIQNFITALNKEYFCLFEDSFNVLIAPIYVDMLELHKEMLSEMDSVFKN